MSPGHHRACEATKNKRADLHHAIVRCITSYVNSLNGCTAASKALTLTPGKGSKIPDISLSLPSKKLIIEVKTHEARSDPDFPKWCRQKRAAAETKYAAFAHSYTGSPKVHVLCISTDGRYDAPSHTILRNLAKLSDQHPVMAPTASPTPDIYSKLSAIIATTEDMVLHNYLRAALTRPTTTGGPDPGDTKDHDNSDQDSETTTSDSHSDPDYAVSL